MEWLLWFDLSNNDTNNEITCTLSDFSLNKKISFPLYTYNIDQDNYLDLQQIDYSIINNLNHYLSINDKIYLINIDVDKTLDFIKKKLPLLYTKLTNLYINSEIFYLIYKQLNNNTIKF